MTDETLPPDLPPGVTALPPGDVDPSKLNLESNPHADIQISANEYRIASLKCLHTISNHICALALSAKQPDQKKQGRMVPMSPQDQMYHTAMQHDLNTYMDKLLGWDTYAQQMTPTLAVDNDAPPMPQLDTSFLDPKTDPDKSA